MIERLSDQLKKEFPDVVIVDDLNHDSPFALFGFESPNGWFQILYHAFDQMQQRVNEHQAIVRIRQIKEKYGSLRLYIQTNDDTCKRIADEAEEQSETICEVCGAMGKLDDRGWSKVRCELHREDRVSVMSNAQIIALVTQFMRNQ